jgi:hypothetical protein
VYCPGVHEVLARLPTHANVLVVGTSAHPRHVQEEPMRHRASVAAPACRARLCCHSADAHPVLLTVGRDLPSCSGMRRLSGVRRPEPCSFEAEVAFATASKPPPEVDRWPYAEAVPALSERSITIHAPAGDYPYLAWVSGSRAGASHAHRHDRRHGRRLHLAHAAVVLRHLTIDVNCSRSGTCPGLETSSNNRYATGTA